MEVLNVRIIWTKIWTTILALMLTPIMLLGYIVLGCLAAIGGVIYTITGKRTDAINRYVKKECERLART